MSADGLQGLRNAVRGTRATVLACLLLVVFVAQTAVARGHFHLGFLSGALQLAPVEACEAQPDKAPLRHDESHCPLWHAAGISGAAVAPSAPAMFVPRAGVDLASTDLRTLFPERHAAAWRSRAPPTL
jgi:hypothetical protein